MSIRLALERRVLLLLENIATRHRLVLIDTDHYAQLAAAASKAPPEPPKPPCHLPKHLVLEKTSRTQDGEVLYHLVDITRPARHILRREDYDAAFARMNTP